MNPIYCAIDMPDLDAAERLVDAVSEHVGGIKLGLEFFMAHGAIGYRAIAAKSLPIFLDVKLHDIPNTVAGAISSLLALRPNFITIHAGGGVAMMRAAAEAAAKGGALRPKLLAVTVLTSLDAKDLSLVGQDPNTIQQVLRLAKLAKESGLDGCICSPEEISALREALGKDFILMVPGIRPSWAAANDQKRVLTPRQAIEAGATHLVIGRPITKADDPTQAAERIVLELKTP
jgi:orotidine-5'-phosphate decarboxylase